MTQIETNGVVAAAPSQSPPPGIYAPVITIFSKDKRQDLDLEAQAVHAVRYRYPQFLEKLTFNRLAEAGMTGLVIQGSNGEAAHLSHDERSHTVRTIKAALDDAGYPDLPLIVGTGASSVRETIQLCKQVPDLTCHGL
jgi:4-hydroxy-2-oxoglutarate aldolase